MTIRKFELPSGERVADIDPSMSTDEIRQAYAYEHPELTNASIETRTEGDATIHKFVVKVGKKG